MGPAERHRTATLLTAAADKARVRRVTRNLLAEVKRRARRGEDVTKLNHADLMKGKKNG